MKSFDISLHLRNKSKDAANEGVRILREIKETINLFSVNMRRVKIPPAAFVLSVCFILATVLGIQNYYSSFFHMVMVEGEEIGLVRDTEDVEEIVDELVEAKSLKYSFKVFAEKEITYSDLEYRFRGTERLDEVQEIIKERLTFYTVGYHVYIDEEPVLHVESNTVLEELIDALKQRYISTRRDTEIIDISTSENITGEWVRVAPEKIKTLGEAFVLFYPDNASDRVYLASRGDTLRDIASNNNIDVDELEDINPQLKNESLEEGQEINVPEADSLINIIAVEEYKEEEEISYDKEYIYNNDMDADESNIKTEGEPGIKETTYRITKKNGEEIERENVGEKITKKPVNRVIEQGTKSYSVAGGREGTGQFIWPVPSSYDGGGRITRGFTGGHAGIDIYAGTLTNTPIIASDSGTVVASHYHSGYGNMIVISHGSYFTVYAHNSRSLVKTGQEVEQGSVIGYMGNTGQTFGRTGIHLHFEIRRGSSGNWQQARPLNPMNFF